MYVAPGIPDRQNFPTIRAVSKPESWQFVVQEHHADKAGKHYDLRLGDPTSGHGHSWALRYWPAPGEKRLAIHQPVHTIKYFDFQGEITDGYGKGKVTTFKRGKAEIVESGQRVIKFLIPEGSRMTEFVLVKTSEKNWLLVSKKPFDPSEAEKLKFRKKEIGELDLSDTSKILAAKIDGASSHIHLNKGQIPKAFSFRSSKRHGGPIEYTAKVKHLLGSKTPPELDRTILSGEVFIPGKGKPTAVGLIGGALNAGLDKSRELQKQHGDLRIALYDVQKYKGKDVSDLPYVEKRKILEKVKKEMPGFALPSMASTLSQKKKLIQDILSRKHRQTIEGVVEWNKSPTKVPFHNQDDVWIVGVAGAKKGSKYDTTHGGALVYSYTKNGSRVGTIGSGFTDRDRRDMVENEANWIGKKVVVQHKGKTTAGVLRAPVFKGHHLG